MCLQQLRGVLLDQNAALEFEAGPITPVLVRIAGITIHAAVLAPLVGVHAVRHADVKAGYFVDDGLGMDSGKLSAFPLLFPVHPQMIAEFGQGFVPEFFKPVGMAALRTAPFQVVGNI